MRFYKLIIITLLTILSLFSSAQEYSHVKYDEKDGLASSTVYDICQDINGFIWFATENGVSRFDGTHFKTFTTKDGLPDNAVLRILGDKMGRIWMIPFTYPVCFLQHDSIKQLQIPERFKNDISNTTGLDNFPGGMIISTASKHIYSVNDSGQIISWRELYKSFPEKAAVSYSSDTTIVIVSGDSLFYKSGNQFKYICKNDPLKIVLKYENGKIVTFADKVSKESVYPSRYLENKIFCAFLNNTVYFFDCETGKLLYSIQVNKFSRALIDTEDNLWITTLGNGVYRFPSRSIRQIWFDDKSPEIFSIAAFNDKIVAGSDYSNLHTFNPADGSSTTKDFSEFLRHSGNMPAIASRRNRLFKLLSYDKELYAGGDAFFIKKDRNDHYRVKIIFPVKDIDITGNDMLVCTSTGAFLLDPGTLNVKDTLLTQRTTTGVFYNDSYFIGTIGGLIKMNQKTKAVTMLKVEDAAFAKRIISIKRGTNNDLWIATSGSGLIHYKENSVIGHFNSSNGISSDFCTSLFIDSTEVWLGTIRGLNRILFNGKNSKIIQYTTADGLASNIINAILVFDKTVYAGTPRGITYFNKDIIGEKSTSLLHWLGVSANDSALQLADHYRFPFGTLNIRFDFVGISFKSAGEIKYYYQMEGLDEKWNSTTNSFVNFATLPPGTYHFKVKAVNKFGVESDIKEITVTINKPWWQQWWFISAVLLFTFLLITWFYKRRVNLIKRNEKNKRELYSQYAALEQQALQAQMNPHFIFNCLNSIQSFIINQDVAGANRYLNSFASLIRQTLDNSADVVISLATEIKYLETYLVLESMRFEDKFSYSLTVDQNIDIHDTFLPSMLLQPYIENAIRHGIQHRADNKGKVSIQFIKNEKEEFLCIISDNGVGRKRSEELKSGQHIEYMSKGTAITQKRIEMLNKQYDTKIIIHTEDIIGEDNLVSGTKVTINFPDSVFKK